jgi:hypothetical protein
MYVTLASGSTIPAPTFTGVAKFADGTSLLPSIAFSGATTTGFFRSGSAIGIAAAATQVGTFDATGLTLNVLTWGIGFSDAVISRISAGSVAATTGRWSVKQGAAAASGAQITLGTDGNRFQITGTTQSDLILSTGWQGGSIVTLHFQGSVTVRHNQAPSGAFHPLMLAGAANFSATANDQLTLQYDSTDSKWYEIGRTVI